MANTLKSEISPLKSGERILIIVEKVENILFLRVAAGITREVPAVNPTEYTYNWTWSGYNPVAAGWEQYNPKQKFGPAVREHYTVHFVLSGCGTLTVKGNTYHPKANDLFMISPYESAVYEADAADPWSVVWVNFIITGTVPYMFEAPLLHAPFARSGFESIRDYGDHSNTGRDFVTKCLWELARQLSTRATASRQLVEDALRYISLNYSRDTLSVSEIADYLQVSRSTLSNLFTAEKGISPSQYLIRFRLEKACEYMTKQKLSPTAAANSIGYNNYTNFTKIFKKYYGVAPRDYLRENGD